MADPAKVNDQNILPVQALFNLDNSFNTFIGQGQPFYATVKPQQSGLQITNSTIDSTTIGATTPSTGVFTNIQTTTGQVINSPVNSTDIVNLFTLQAYAAGLYWKAPVQAATTANITLSGLQTIDGYTTLANDRVLVKNQSNAANNGIYVASAGVWTRSSDMNTWSEVVSAITFVENGTTQTGTGWYSTAQNGGTLGVTAINFSSFTLSAPYTAGTGLTLTGTQFSITNTGVTASTYGSASSVPVLAINAQGQVTSATPTSIAIAASQITSGTIASSLISGSYTGITGVGTLTAGTWNASTIGVPYGGTGATSLTGYVKGTGTSALTAVTSIPNTDITGLGTMSTQNANSVAITGGTISGLSSPIPVASGGTGAATLSGYVFGNGTGAFTASSTIPNTAITGLGTMSTQNANSVAITGGTINGASIGATTRSSGDFTTLSANSVTSTTPVLSFNASNSIASFGSTTANSYNQLVIQNKSTSAFASANYVISNDIGTDSSYYGEFGMNSSTFSASTPSDFYSINNGVYFSGHDGDITFGSGNGYKSYFAWGSTGQYAHVINSSGALGFSTNLGTTPALSGTTGYGTSGQALVTGGSTAAPAWGVVGINGGGTNGTATPTAGAIAYGTGTAYAFTAAGSTGQVLTSNGSGVPTWSSAGTSITLSDDTTTNATRYPLFAAATSGTVSTEYTSSTKYQYNPSTGVLTATGFSGSGASLTSLTAGNLTGTIPSGVLGNSTVYIGTTAIALNRASASQTLTGTSIDGNAGTATTATTATNATNVAITDDTSTNATFYPTFVSTSSSNQAVETSSTKLKYNPSTGTLTSTIVQSGTQANYIQSTGAATTFEPTITAAGSDTNVALAIKTQGTGAIDLAAGSSGVNISNGGTVTALTVTAGGGSYTSIPTPTITVPTTAGAVQATASCNMLLANTPTVTSGGTGYSVNDVLTISGGTFSAAGQLTVTAVSGGVITAATISAYGTYTVLPSSPVSVTGGTGTGATFTVTWGVRSLNITAAGSGYVEQPTVSFSGGGGGSGAAAYATVGGTTIFKTIGGVNYFNTPGGTQFSYADNAGATTTAWWGAIGSTTVADFRTQGGGVTAGAFTTQTSVPLIFRTNFTQQFAVAHTSSAVNYVQVTGSATGVSTQITAQGSDSSISLAMSSKGGGSLRFFTNNVAQEQFRVAHTNNAVNFLNVTGSAAGAAPVLSAQGTDTNIDLTLTPKGTGVVRGQGVAVSSENGIFLSKQTVATSMTVAAGYSAMSSGPITVASGVTVTLSSGSRWVIL